MRTDAHRRLRLSEPADQFLGKGLSIDRMTHALDITARLARLVIDATPHCS
jgi:hypothetical protein